MDYIKYELWPAVKVWSRYYWWVVKYGGKKNIPPEVLWKQMAESMKRTADSLEQALRVVPDNISEEEKRELLSVMSTVADLEREVKDIENKKASDVENEKSL